MARSGGKTILTAEEPSTRLAAGFPPVYERLSFRVHQLNAQLARVCNPLFRQYGVDLISSRILVLVLELGAIRAGELVDLMILPQSTISHQLQRLEKLGYLERSRRDEDQRVVTVSLTPTGRLVAIACEKLSLSVYTILMDGVAPESLECMTEEINGMLRRLAEIGD